MSNKDNGGPAFPETWNGQYVSGMTLRDYFAAKAMQAAISTSASPYMCEDKTTDPEIAKMAYGIADAMLVERKRGS